MKYLVFSRGGSIAADNFALGFLKTHPNPVAAIATSGGYWGVKKHSHRGADDSLEFNLKHQAKRGDFFDINFWQLAWDKIRGRKIKGILNYSKIEKKIEEFCKAGSEKYPVLSYCIDIKTMDVEYTESISATSSVAPLFIPVEGRYIDLADRMDVPNHEVGWVMRLKDADTLFYLSIYLPLRDPLTDKQLAEMDLLDIYEHITYQEIAQRTIVQKMELEAMCMRNNWQFKFVQPNRYLSLTEFNREHVFRCFNAGVDAGESV